MRTKLEKLDDGLVLFCLIAFVCLWLVIFGLPWRPMLVSCVALTLVITIVINLREEGG